MGRARSSTLIQYAFMSRPAATVALLSAALLALFLLPASGQSALVSAGSAWRYFDQGSEPAGWKTIGFNDAGWSNGVAQLGFGGDGEATTVARTNAGGTTNIAFYFRRTFNVPDPSLYSNLLVRLRRDDGAVVYLNEQEIFRSNMPPGPVNSNTLALNTAADDGTNFFASLVSPALINTGGNQLAVEIHQSGIASSDISFELEFSGNVNTTTNYQSPSVNLTSPLSGDTIGATALTLAAAASDPDGTIALVEFFDGTSWLGTVTAPTNNAYTLRWTGIAAGTHVITAMAVDSTGLSSVSAPATIWVLPALVPRGASWKYLDGGTAPGAGWQGSLFDDSGWSNGVAQLGYGDGDEATVISYGPDSTNKYITSYYRHAFTAPDPVGITNLSLRVQRDDGAVVYLNGIEIFRNNMPTGAVTQSTTALTAIDDDSFHGKQVNSALLLAGPNLIAAEIHQASLTSSDVSFDLELLPNVSPMTPAVALTSPANGNSFLGPLTLSLTAVTSDVDSSVASVAFLDGTNDLGTTAVDVIGGAAISSLFAPGAHSIRAVATDAQGLSTTSAPVGITVIPAPLLATLVATGSVWRYFDTNYAPAAGWRDAAFDDAGWKNGPGILGYGQLGSTVQFTTSRTTIYSGPNANNRPITAYFRRTFNATNAASITNLAFRVLHDDGVVIHLNGAELFRMNMPPDAPFYATLATSGVVGTNEFFYEPVNVEPPAGVVLEGTNILAVELHQNLATTGDAGFDLGLVAISPSTPRPRLQVQFDAAGIQLIWNDPNFVLEEAGLPQGPYSPSTNATSPAVFVPSPPARFFRLVRP